MPVGWKMQNIVFDRKVDNFQYGDYCVKNLHISYKRVSTEYSKDENAFLKHISCL